MKYSDLDRTDKRLPLGFHHTVDTRIWRQAWMALAKPIEQRLHLRCTDFGKDLKFQTAAEFGMPDTTVMTAEFALRLIDSWDARPPDFKLAENYAFPLYTFKEFKEFAKTVTDKDGRGYFVTGGGPFRRGKVYKSIILWPSACATVVKPNWARRVVWAPSGMQIFL